MNADQAILKVVIFCAGMGFGIMLTMCSLSGVFTREWWTRKREDET